MKTEIIELLNLFIGINGVFAAFFFFFEQYQKEESEQMRLIIHKIWNKVGLDGWMNIPKNGLNSFLLIKKIPNYVWDIFLKVAKTKFQTPVALIAMSPIMLIFLYQSVIKPKIFLLTTIPHLVLFILVFFWITEIFINYKKRKEDNAFIKNSQHPIKILNLISISLFYILVGIDSIQILFSEITTYLNSITVDNYIIKQFLRLIISIILSIIISSILVYASLFVADTIGKFSRKGKAYWEDQVLYLWGTITFSITASVLAIFIGFISSAGVNYVFTIQLIVSNFIFDYFTILVSLKIIKTILIQKSIFIAILLISLDIIIAGIFACLSLYFGLFMSIDQFSTSEIFRILVFDSSIINKVGYYKYYAALMHTSFIPTLIYFLIIMSMFLGKIILKYSKFFLVPKNKLKRPYSLTRAFFLFVAALGILIRYLII